MSRTTGMAHYELSFDKETIDTVEIERKRGVKIRELASNGLFMCYGFSLGNTYSGLDYFFPTHIKEQDESSRILVAKSLVVFTGQKFAQKIPSIIREVMKLVKDDNLTQGSISNIKIKKSDLKYIDMDNLKDVLSGASISDLYARKVRNAK